MKCKIILLTPEVARELLSRNTENRNLRTNSIYYTKQMQSGEWKENGESIIMDKNGVMKDGQHRCESVIRANFSYHVPLIEDVDPDVMETIDTGYNRSLSDVLNLNGFMYYAQMAGTIKSILMYKDGNEAASTTAANKDRKIPISNVRGLVYAKKHRVDLEKLMSVGASINGKQPVNIISSSDLGLYLYVLQGYNFDEFGIDFMKSICGVNTNEGDAATWVYKKFIYYKKEKVTLSRVWKLRAIIKAWNLYVNGNASIVSLRINMKTPIENILKF